MQKTLLFLFHCFITTITWSQVTIGTDSLYYRLPVSTSDNFSYSQVIYPVSAIKSSGTITGLRYIKSGTAIGGSDRWTIYMGHTTKTAYTSTTSWIPTSAMIQVFTGTVVQVGKDVEVTLDTPFNYNGTDNLVIAVDENFGFSTSGDAGNFYGSRSYSELNTALVYSGPNNPNPDSPIAAKYYTAGLANVTLLGLPAPSCLPLDGLKASMIAGDQATLSWNGGAGATVEIDYGLSGHIVGTGTKLLLTGNTTQISGLSELTTYYAYLRTICGPGDTSVWVGPHSFETPCYNQIPPYLEDFNVYTPFATCWTEKRGSLSPSNTIFDDDYSTWQSGILGNYGNTYAAAIEITGSGRKDWLISPTIDLGNGTIPYQLELDVALTDSYDTNSINFGTGDSLALVISSDNGITWNRAGILKLWVAGSEPPSKGEHYVVDLSAYTGLIKIGLYGGTSNGSTAGAQVTIDNFLIHEVPTCAQATGVGFGTITSSTADLFWNTTASHSIIEYGPKGFSLGSGTRLVSTGGAITLTNLSGFTDYDFYIIDSCAVSDISLVSRAYYFKTLCSFYEIPYLQEFAGITFDCWAQYNGVLLSDNSVLISTASFTGWTYGGFANNGFSGATTIDLNYLGINEWQISPSIDLGNGSKPYQLEFDLALTTVSGTGATTFNSDDSLFLLISPDNGVTWNRSSILRIWAAGDEPRNTGDHFIFDLSAYTGMVQFAFYASSSIINGNKMISIDNFEIPSCARPNNVQANALDANNVEVSWTKVAPHTLIEYGLAGFTPGSGTVVLSTSNTKIITGLNHNTEYEIYIRDSCGPGDLSPWVGPILVRTFCQIYQSPFVENFDTYLPECWEEKQGILGTVNTTFTDQTSPLWRELGFANQGFTGSAGVNITGQYGANWLITPSIDLGTGTTPLQVQFKIASTSSLNSDFESWGSDDSLILVISTDNGLSWKQNDKVLTWTKNNIPSTTGDFIIYELTGYTGIVKFGFYAATPISGNNFNVYIDTFEIVPIPACQQPLNVKVSNITSSATSVFWTPGTADITIEYGPVGFVLGTGTKMTTVNNSAFISGLTANTSYAIYVRDSCGIGNVSLWSGPIFFTTKCENTIPAYLEDFSLYPPLCWSEFKGKLEPGMNITNPYSSIWTEGGFGNVGSTGAARINIYSPATNGERYEWLVSPSIDFGNGSNSYRLEFDLALTNYLTTASASFDADDSLCLVVSKDDGQTWKKENILRVWKMGSEPSNTGDFITQALPGYNGIVKFAFYAATTKSGKNVNAYVDNFHIVTCTPTTHTISPTVCGSYTSPSGKTHAVSGQYMDTIANFLNCDSIITINLTVGQTSNTTLIETSCNSYVSKAGNTYTSSGTFTEILTNAVGCDSISTLVLTIIVPNIGITNNDPTLIANESSATYTWLDCNNNLAIIAGETAKQFTATENGSYAVIVNKSNCVDTSLCVQINSIVGLNELAEPGMRLVPNPTYDQISLSVPSNIAVDAIELLNAQGKTIQSFQMEKDQSEKNIDLTHFQSGIYFVQLKLGGISYVEKVIKL